MPTPAAYTRVIVDGIPYWKSADGYLYYYESSAQPTTENRICLGTEAAGLYSDWQARLEERLQAYRTASTAYNRQPAAAAKVDSSGPGAAASKPSSS
jgi:hypothetical protein